MHVLWVGETEKESLEGAGLKCSGPPSQAHHSDESLFAEWAASER